MGLSKLAAKCQACPFVDTCNHKRMEALGYLPLPEQTTERLGTNVLQVSLTTGQIVRMTQKPFEESIRAYLSMEVREMRNLK